MRSSLAEEDQKHSMKRLILLKLKLTNPAPPGATLRRHNG